MQLNQVHDEWESLAQHDAFWAVLSAAGKRYGNWDAREFFQTGVQEINEVIKQTQKLGWIPSAGLAVDFGCGIGRLSQALCDHFDNVVGIDISETMIKSARKFNRHGDKCTYVLNKSDQLDFIPDRSAQFVYSRIVFQHMPPDLAMNYIRQLCEKLSEGGALAFQVPSEEKPKSRMSTIGALRSSISNFTPEWLKRQYRRARARPISGPMSMYTIPRQQVEKLLTDSGLTILSVTPDDSAPSFESYFYTATR